MVWSTLGIFLIAIAFLLIISNRDTGLKSIPVVRFNPYWPDIFNRFLYYPKASSLIYAGYRKYKTTPFRVLTGDTDIVVLPIKYLDEFKRIPNDIISSLEAQYQNALGDFTNILINSRLPTATVKRRLTPRLTQVVPLIVDELRHAFDHVMPECEDHWAGVKPQEIFIHLVVRATSRIIAGDKLRYNKEWLHIAAEYPMSIGITVLLLRPVPRFLRPLVAPFLPPIRQMKRQLRFVKDLFASIIVDRKAAEIEHAGDPSYEKPDDFLQWMMDLADDEEEKDPEQLAHHLLILMSLAVAHTSSMAMCHALFDLIEHPEYLPPLREEVYMTLEDGWDKATKVSFENQRRLDSFMRESQRFGPPGELSSQRIVMQDLIMSDGLVLPKNTHICFPSGPASRDPALVPNPETFDGFRWCSDPDDRNALSQFMPSESNNGSKEILPTPSKRTTFVDISPESMHFGAGRQACPGRFFAANTIKVVLSRILMDYDFKYEEKFDGKRPPNVVVGEHILPNMGAQVLFRKRSVGVH